MANFSGAAERRGMNAYFAYAVLGRALWALTSGNARYRKAQNNIFGCLLTGIGLKIALD